MPKARKASGGVVVVRAGSERERLQMLPQSTSDVLSFVFATRYGDERIELVLVLG
jgi:hypothetical protein